MREGGFANDSEVASRRYGDTVTLHGGYWYRLTASYTCNTTADREYYTNSGLRLDSWTFALLATSANSRLTDC